LPGKVALLVEELAAGCAPGIELHGEGSSSQRTAVVARRDLRLLDHAPAPLCAGHRLLGRQQPCVVRRDGRGENQRVGQACDDHEEIEKRR
jgi:hypothetical protein